MTHGHHQTVALGMIGSGFVAEFYMAGLDDVPGAQVVANYSRSAERAEDFGSRFGIPRQYTDVEALCADDEVQMVIIGLPNHMHLDAIRTAAQAGKAIVCTKPLARNADEAAEIVRIVRQAGVLHGYAETEVFAPNVVKAREMIESGAIGEIISVRAREAHSGPHAPHFWDAETAGGGALLDMGCHTIEAARYLFGKDVAMTEAFAWGATLTHGDKTTGEDNAVAMIKFANGGISITEASLVNEGRHGAAQRDHRHRRPARDRLARHADPRLHHQARRLPDREGRRRDRLGLPAARRGARLRLQPGAAPLHRLLPLRRRPRARTSSTATSSTAPSTPATAR